MQHYKQLQLRCTIYGKTFQVGKLLQRGKWLFTRKLSWLHASRLLLPISKAIDSHIYRLHQEHRKALESGGATEAWQGWFVWQKYNSYEVIKSGGMAPWPPILTPIDYTFAFNDSQEKVCDWVRNYESFSTQNFCDHN